MGVVIGLIIASIIAIFGFLACRLALKRRPKGVIKDPGPVFKVSLKKKNSQCPLCLSRLTPTIKACKKCFVVYHLDCLNELANGKCATNGCSNALSASRSKRVSISN